MNDLVQPTSLQFQEAPLNSSDDESLSASDISDEDLSKDFVAFTHDQEGLLSRFLYSWVGRIIREGNKRPLELEDVGFPPESDRATRLLDTFETHKARYGSSPAGIWKALLKMYGWNMALAGLVMFIGNCFNLLGPVMMSVFLNKIERIHRGEGDKGFMEEYLGEMYLFVVGFLLFAFIALGSATLQKHHHIVMRNGSMARNTLVISVYRKMMVANHNKIESFGLGKLMNVTTTDANRITELCYFVHYVWAGPLQATLALLLILHFIGPSGIVGFLLTLLIFPLQKIIADRLSAIRNKSRVITDDRVKMLREMLQGVLVVKFHAWEVPFVKRITALRDKEMSLLLMSAVWKGASLFLTNSSPLIVAAVTFLVYVQFEELTAEKAFTTIALLSMLRPSLSMVTRVISLAIEASISIQRVSEFMQLEDLDAYLHESEGHSKSYKMGIRQRLKRLRLKSKRYVKVDVNTLDSDVVRPAMERESTRSHPIVMEHASFAFDDEWIEKPVIKDISLTVNEGSLLMVGGTIGSGKSSLLLSMIGELKLISGTSHIHGTVAYVASKSWIKNDTLRDNILFGRRFNKERYDATIDMCALATDIRGMAKGDATEIGESGVNLSGGQKQRLSLARAVYADADVYILDDPLAACDHTVSKSIMTRCIAGHLAEKTVVMVCHEKSYFQHADQVIMLADGEVISFGKPSEVLREASPEQRGMENNDEPTETKADSNDDGMLIVAEDRAVGRVGAQVYMHYAKAVGLFWVAVLFFGVLAAELARVAKDFSLSAWSGDTEGSHSVGYYLFWFIIISAIAVVFNAVKSFMGSYVCVRASRTLHREMLLGVSGAPLSFFTSTPLGRVVNRFSGDIAVLDETLAASLQSLIDSLFGLVVLLAVCVVVLPLVFLIIIPVAIFNMVLLRYYVSTTRELKRIDNISRSPIFSLISESLNGLVVIRSFQKQVIFMRDLSRKIDMNNAANLINNTTNRWLGVRLELIGAFVLLTVVLMLAWNRSSVDPGMAGVLISYGLLSSTFLNWSVRYATDVESQMSSCERILHYVNLDSEIDVVSPSQDALTTANRFVDAGEVKIENLVVAYRADREPVLKDLTVTIAAGQRVGIVGRTGSGKSTLLLSLFRLLPFQSGRILIDGSDICSIPLRFLRSSLAIIPQDPVLFSGTVRSNLDPFDEHSDNEIRNALEQAELKGMNGETVVAENGSNFSAGERQLICFARAILCDTKIMVLDEATASIDPETDDAIQSMLREKFIGRTIITVAHRLSTIMDYDTVVVLDKGKVVEQGPPRDLSENQGGHFNRMVYGG